MTTTKPSPELKAGLRAMGGQPLADRPTRKLVTMMVAVTVPASMTSAQARREVRFLIADQCNASAEPGDIKPIAIRPLPRPSNVQGAA